MNKDFDKKIAMAESAVKAMDEMDAKNGFITPLEGGILPTLDTISVAIIASTQTDDDSSLYEALVMLKQLIKKIKDDE